jgi:N-acetylmuramoyl-L-alanine amidase
MNVCIDAGHSGLLEPGACAAGYTEAAINLSISLLLGGLLAKKGYVCHRDGSSDTLLINLIPKNRPFYYSVQCQML